MNSKVFYWVMVSYLSCLCLTPIKGFSYDMQTRFKWELTMEMTHQIPDQYSPLLPLFAPELPVTPQPLNADEETKTLLRPVSMLPNQEGDGRPYAIFNQASRGCLARAIEPDERLFYKSAKLDFPAYL